MIDLLAINESAANAVGFPRLHGVTYAPARNASGVTRSSEIAYVSPLAWLTAFPEEGFQVSGSRSCQHRQGP